MVNGGYAFYCKEVCVSEGLVYARSTRIEGKRIAHGIRQKKRKRCGEREGGREEEMGMKGIDRVGGRGDGVGDE